MRRALNFIETGNPHEDYLYDHPYMGQILLGTVLSATNYQNTSVISDPQSLQNLYLIPRLFVGIIAMIDTLLIYKISEVKFGRHAGLLASTLFAVMPFTWIFRRILLDSLLMPFLLASILLAIYYSKSNGKNWIVLLSGVLLGIAIFTKIPAFTFIPLVVWLVYQNQKKIRSILLVLVPAVLIPLIWPAHSILSGQFDLFLRDILWQAQRESSIFGIAKFFLYIDPVLFLIGIGGIIHSIISKNKFILLWFVPFFAFLSLVGFKQYFHWMLLVPVFCIAASLMIIKISEKLKFSQIKYVISIPILVFGVLVTGFLVTSDASIVQFEALSFVINNTDQNDTVLASPVYSWVLYHFFSWQHVPKDYSQILFYPLDPTNITIVSDGHFRLDRARGENLQLAYDRTIPVTNFENNMTRFDSSVYPFSNFQFTMDSQPIEIRKGVWK